MIERDFGADVGARSPFSTGNSEQFVRIHEQTDNTSTILLEDTDNERYTFPVNVRDPKTFHTLVLANYSEFDRDFDQRLTEIELLNASTSRINTGVQRDVAQILLNNYSTFSTLWNVKTDYRVLSRSDMGEFSKAIADDVPKPSYVPLMTLKYGFVGAVGGLAAGSLLNLMSGGTGRALIPFLAIGVGAMCAGIGYSDAMRYRDFRALIRDSKDFDL